MTNLLIFFLSGCSTFILQSPFALAAKLVDQEKFTREFRGKIDSKHEVLLSLEIQGGLILKGRYFYVKSKIDDSMVPEISLCIDHKNNSVKSVVILKECTEKEKITGIWTGNISETGDFSGSWKKTKDSKNLFFKLSPILESDSEDYNFFSREKNALITKGTPVKLGNISYQIIKLSYKSVDPENRPYAYEIKYPFIVGGVSPEVRERLNVQFKHRAQHSISSGSYKMKFSEVKDDIFEVNEQYESYGITNIPRAAPDKVADFNWWFSTKDGRACEIEECFLGLNELKSSAFSFTDSMDLKSARSENAKRKDSAHDVASSCDGDLSVSLVSIKKGEVLIRLRKYEFPDNECDRSVVMSLEKVRKFFMEDQILEAFIKAK